MDKDDDAIKRLRVEYDRALRLFGELTLQRQLLEERIAAVRADIESLDKVASVFKRDGQ